MADRLAYDTTMFTSLRAASRAATAFSALLGEQLPNLLLDDSAGIGLEIEQAGDVVIGADTGRLRLLADLHHRNARLGHRPGAALLVDARDQGVQFGFVADREQQTAAHLGIIDVGTVRRDEQEEFLFQIEPRFGRILQQRKQVLLLFGGELLRLVQLRFQAVEERIGGGVARPALLQERCGIDRHRHERIGRQHVPVIGTAAAGDDQRSRSRQAGQFHDG